jgi:hypothetical protein
LVVGAWQPAQELECVLGAVAPAEARDLAHTQDPAVLYGGGAERARVTHPPTHLSTAVLGSTPISAWRLASLHAGHSMCRCRPPDCHMLHTRQAAVPALNNLDNNSSACTATPAVGLHTTDRTIDAMLTNPMLWQQLWCQPRRRDGQLSIGLLGLEENHT